MSATKAIHTVIDEGPFAGCPFRGELGLGVVGATIDQSAARIMSVIRIDQSRMYARPAGLPIARAAWPWAQVSQWPVPRDNQVIVPGLGNDFPQRKQPDVVVDEILDELPCPFDGVDKPDLRR